MESLKKNTVPVFLLVLVIFQITGVGITYFFQMLHYKSQHAGTINSKEKSTLWVSAGYWQKHKDHPRKNEIIVDGIYYDIHEFSIEKELVKIIGHKDTHENIFIYIIDFISAEEDGNKNSFTKNYWQFLFFVPNTNHLFYLLKTGSKTGISFYKEGISATFLQDVFRPPIGVFHFNKSNAIF